MDSEVARTLAELERKLQELERAVSAAGSDYRRQETTAYEPATAAGTIDTFAGSGARLVDERLESAAAAAAPVPAPAPTAAPTPAMAPTAAAAPTAAQPHDRADSIDLVELARFRDRLEQTTRDLLADYERIIRLRSLPESQDPAP